MKMSKTPSKYDAMVTSLAPIWRSAGGFTKDQMRSIKARTVIADGDRDEIINLDHIREMALLIPNAKSVVFEDTSHFALWQDPESFNKALLEFLDAIRSGQRASAPLYSHLAYDVTDQRIEIDRPDILILEGINVLAAGMPGRPFVSDFFDFSIYVDAPEPLIRSWFLDRFHHLRTTAFRDPASYFHRYAAMTEAEAHAFATHIWETINAVNLRENIAPTRERATLVLEKGTDHRIASVALRRL
jgi:type I pantothenate kinase